MREWKEIEAALLKQLKKGHDLRTSRCRNKWRKVVALPQQHKSSGFFRVQIGEKSFINVSLEMLKKVIAQSKKNNGKYNTKVFRSIKEFQKLKDCYVHVIGKLLQAAGCAKTIDEKEYQII